MAYKDMGYMELLEPATKVRIKEDLDRYIMSHDYKITELARIMNMDIMNLKNFLRDPTRRRFEVVIKITRFLDAEHAKSDKINDPFDF